MKKPPLIITNILVFIITGFFGLIVAPYYAFTNGISLFEILATLICIIFSGISITAGYHRLWSHKTYQAHAVVRFFYAIGGALALQNSALHWSSDHRVHHHHVDDNDKDPYSAKMGFWYSHIGWMLREYQASRYSDYSNVGDLQKDPIVMWQHKYYLPLVLATNFGIPILLGLISGNVWAMLLYAGFFRLVFVHHTTFMINSLAHIWGSQPYTDENTAKDNGILAFFTFGEGYHNYHHKFAMDYRNGIRWWHFDPSKWLIVTLKQLGLASHLKKCSKERIEKALILQQMKIAKAKAQTHHNCEELLNKIQLEYDVLVVKLSEFYQAKKQLLDAKKQTIKDNYDSSEIAKRYKELKQAVQDQKRNWQSLTAQFA